MIREIPYSDWSDLSPGPGKGPTPFPVHRSEGEEGSGAPEENCHYSMKQNEWVLGGQNLTSIRCDGKENIHRHVSWSLCV